MKYNSSDFMKMLGKQILTAHCENEDIYARFDEIIKANKVPEIISESQFIRELMVDAFLYGTIQGIRSERSRRNGKEL